jgi:translation initiation factor 1
MVNCQLSIVNYYRFNFFFCGGSRLYAPALFDNFDYICTMKKNDWKERLGVMYSTNPDYRYDTEESPERDTPDKARQLLRISLDKRHRGGKCVTLVTGFEGRSDDLEELGRRLKTKCGVGGSAKDGEIIIQGDLRAKALDILLKEGYVKSRII